MSVDPERDEVCRSGLDSLPAGEFLRASPDPTVTVGLDGTVRAANPAVERVLGYSPAAIVGEPASRLLPDRFVASAREIAVEYVETGTSPVGTMGLEVFARHAEGHEVPVSVTLVEHEHAGEPVVSAVAREITSRIDREAELTRERDRLAEALDALAADPGSELISVADVATEAWGSVRTGDETVSIDTTRTVETDARRLTALFAALFASTAPADGEIVVEDADGGVRVAGAAVATDLGGAPALAQALDAEVDRAVDAVTIRC